jgi:GTPase SAR1 family protein
VEFASDEEKFDFWFTTKNVTTLYLTITHTRMKTIKVCLLGDASVGKTSMCEYNE